jgi:sodium transport system permease protein
VLTLSGFYLMLRFAPLPATGIPFLFGLAELGRFVVALVPLIALMPAILLYVGCRGRSFKEAQSNLSVLLFVVSLIPVAQMFLQRKEPAWLTWIPVSGQYALLSRALRGEALPVAELLQSYAAPGLLTLAALLAVARLLSRESVLAGR